MKVADIYEIEKGVSDNPSSKTLAPPYPFWKITETNNDVLPGKRYFYRVRGKNATGAGEWSEPVSRVQ